MPKQFRAVERRRFRQCPQGEPDQQTREGGDAGIAEDNGLQGLAFVRQGGRVIALGEAQAEQQHTQEAITAASRPRPLSSTP